MSVDCWELRTFELYAQVTTRYVCTVAVAFRTTVYIATASTSSFILDTLIQNSVWIYLYIYSIYSICTYMYLFSFNTMHRKRYIFLFGEKKETTPFMFIRVVNSVIVLHIIVFCALTSGLRDVKNKGFCCSVHSHTHNDRYIDMICVRTLYTYIILYPRMGIRWVWSVKTEWVRSAV